MHCLLVSSLLPEPEPTTGFEIANRAIVEAYRASGARLTIAGFRRPGSPRALGPDEILLGEMDIENAAVGPLAKGRWVMRAVAGGLPVASAKLRVLDEAALLRSLAAAGPFDAVIVNGAQVAAAFPGLETLGPLIFVAHNVEYLSARQNADAAGKAAIAALYRREARLLERAERAVCRRAEAVHVLSTADAPPLGLAQDRRVVPLSLWIGRETHGGSDEPQRDVGLIGTWSWAPNRAGLDWFVQKVVPLLPADVTIGIAGAIGQRPEAPANVEFHGRVPSAQAFLHASRVVALATTAGTGVQLKSIEVLEEGLPAVATPKALRGIAAPLPARIRVADEPQAFADALLAAIAEGPNAAPQGEAGRAFAQAQRSASVAAAGRAMALAQEAGGTALVTSSYRGDFERCRLLCDSIDRHVSGHSCHYILVEDADRALFAPLEGPRRRVVGEGELLPAWLRPIRDPINPRRRLWVHPFGLPLRGWHVQQLRRMAFGRAMREAVMVSIDSDVVFLRPFDTASLRHGEAVRFYRVPGGLDGVDRRSHAEHRAWSRKAGDLLGLPPERENADTFINTLVAWRRDSVREMMACIESTRRRPALRALAGTRALSECTIYGRFVSEVENRPERHAPTSEALASVYWAGEAMDRAALERFVAAMAPECVAIGIQSFTQTDPAVIRSVAGLT